MSACQFFESIPSSRDNRATCYDTVIWIPPYQNFPRSLRLSHDSLANSKMSATTPLKLLDRTDFLLVHGSLKGSIEGLRTCLHIFYRAPRDDSASCATEQVFLSKEDIDALRKRMVESMEFLQECERMLSAAELEEEKRTGEKFRFDFSID